METQRRFENLGNTLIKITNKFLDNTELCKLLKYADIRDINKCPDFEVETLIDKNIRMKPLLPQEEEKGSFLIVLLDNFAINPENSEFKVMSIRVDILVPYEDWNKIDSTLKPFRIMGIVDTILNNQRISGIGKLQFQSGEVFSVGEKLGGYTLIYGTEDFN